ncbi:MAG: hypothetical protein Q8Q15_04470 [bacterium]|nr:hypothetical protein [bacterium]
MAERIKPLNWPEDVNLPTLEEAQEAVRKGEAQIVEELKKLEGKISSGGPEMKNTEITI